MAAHPSPDACLYLVATPIGNLEDISQRAISILKSCDQIACEDTRKTGRLLEAIQVTSRLCAYHEHNEKECAIYLANCLAAGETIALVVDAGTPGMSDPGFRLVRECRRRGLTVVPIPSPTAMATALCASGLPSDGFLFLGFLPPKGGAHQTFFERYRDFPYTLIFYESCHRIERCLNRLVDTLGTERTICVAREMTKRYETFHTGPALQVKERVLQGSLKGEFVVLIAKKGYEL